MTGSSGVKPPISSPSELGVSWGSEDENGWGGWGGDVRMKQMLNVYTVQVCSLNNTTELKMSKVGTRCLCEL